MRKRRAFLILIGLGVACAVLVLCTREREPEYGGKKLSEWVESMRSPGYTTYAQAKNGILEIGSNAVPYLLKWIRYEPPSWKSKLYAMMNRSAGALHLSYQLTDMRECRAMDSMLALLAL